MAKKEKFTSAEIEKDIITALKNPSGESEESFEKTKVPGTILGIVLGVLLLIRPMIAFWALLAALIVTIGFIIFTLVRRWVQIKKVSIRDYHVSTEIVHSIDEEHYHYHQKRGKFCRKIPVDNYVIRFENGKEWRIPKDNYLWSAERPMSDFAIHQSTHRGDTMTVVTKADTDNVVMAYHTDFFEYDS